MTAYTGTFVKKDGTQRTMTFINMEDLPEDFLKSTIKNTGRKVNLAEGSKVVYDVDARDFRIFNFKTIVGELIEQKVETTRPVEYDGSTTI
jgi:hypothetical protein